MSSIKAEVAEKMYDLADDHVAHRRYLPDLRTVTADIDQEGKNRPQGQWNLPPICELESLTEKL